MMKDLLKKILFPLIISLFMLTGGLFLSSCEDSYGLDANVREKILRPDTIRDTIRDTVRNTEIIYVRDTTRINGYILPDSLYMEVNEVPYFFNDSSKVPKWEQSTIFVTSAIDTSVLTDNKLNLNVSINKSLDKNYSNDQILSMRLHLDSLPVNNNWYNPDEDVSFYLYQARPTKEIVIIDGKKANARVYLQKFSMGYNKQAIDCYFDAAIPTKTNGLVIHFRMRILLFYSL